MKHSSEDLVSNRRATYDYEILETFEAGIVLQGTEIKSIRHHGASLQEAYIKVLSRELWLVGCTITGYQFGNIHNHEEKRERKLLMHKREIERLRKATQEKGLTLIPLALYLKKGIVKVRLAIAKGKKNIDKRADLKEKDDRRRIQQAYKLQSER